MSYRVLALVLAASCWPASAVAQTTDGGFAEQLSPSMAATAKSLHATIRRNLAEAAAAMTAEDYTFQPTPQVRTFARLVGHVVNGNFLLLLDGQGRAAAQHHQPRAGDRPRRADQGAQRGVGLLRRRLHLDDRRQLQRAGLRCRAGTQTARGSVLVFNTTHNNEHYGNMVVYMRLKGRTPPSTARVGRP